MGVSDEFDSGDRAPVPPHERNWRHPAEVSNALRQEHALKATPPPIGRRAAALVAFVSIVASATLMLVTVQKGISEPVAEPSDLTTTTVQKGSLPDGTVMAVRAFGDFFVVPSREVRGARAAISVGGSASIVVDVVTSFPDAGIAVVRPRTNRQSPGDSAPVPTAPDDATSIRAVDRTGSSFRVRQGIYSSAGHTTPGATTDWFPLDVDGVIDGVAALLADGHFYAIAVRHDHRHIGITLTNLSRIVSDATGAGSG